MKWSGKEKEQKGEKIYGEIWLFQRENGEESEL